jgi:thioredoxin reductase (NADPH)
VAKPVILTVDDDRDVLGAIERDLRQKYRQDYRVMKALSGREALDAAQELKRRGTDVALFLADQRMPEMTGTELLAEVSGLYPDARKVLLTAYADTQAAIDSINKVGLDHYLLKPWDPPDQRLYPVLDDLLADWAAHARPTFDGVRVAGARWSRQCYLVKDFLSRNQVPYQWIDLEQDKPMRELVENLTVGLTKLPVVFFPDGGQLVEPSPRDLADKIGLSTRAREPFYDIVIVGGGPAGLANAVYGASEGLRTLLIEMDAPGGQAGTSSRIENYLGFPNGISGGDLARRATAQAQRFGAEMLTTQEVTGVRLDGPYRILQLADGSEVRSYTVLIATGMSVRTLDVPGLEPLVGAGVYYGAAMAEAATYRGQDVCIVGGANSAGQGALFFARYARHVTMLVRGKGLGVAMSQYLVDRIEATPNITVRTRTEICRVAGDGHLERIDVRNVESGEIQALEMAAMFIFIGQAPRSEMLAGLVARDEKGFIVTGPDLPRDERGVKNWPLERDPYLFETSVPGIFAAGDVRAGASRRVAAAVGEGSAAIYSVHKYLETV